MDARRPVLPRRVSGAGIIQVLPKSDSIKNNVAQSIARRVRDLVVGFAP